VPKVHLYDTFLGGLHQVIDLPKPPHHIIIHIKPVKGIKWPQDLNLPPNSDLIQIPTRLTSQCEKKVGVGTQESVTYYAHAVDLAFAITVWKCQGGTFGYILALLEHTPGSPTLTFEKLYAIFYTGENGLSILLLTTFYSI
jgi:hypothetical protein